MIASSLSEDCRAGGRPRLRIREEASGGLAFEPDSGRVCPLDEQQLQEARGRAADDDLTVYYATRDWAGAGLAQGCRSSPSRVYLELTRRCNLRCPFCYANAADATAGEMNFADAVSLIRNLAAMGVHELRLTGGECTTRPDILGVIDEALAAGFFVTLGTNGVMPEEKLQGLLTRNIGRFLISLEGVEPVHDCLRGEGSFRKTVTTIGRMVAAGKRVRVNTLLSRSTLASLQDLVDLCRTLGVRHIALIPPRPLGRAALGDFQADMPDRGIVESAARTIGPLSADYGVQIEFQYDLCRASAGSQQSDPVIQKVLSCPAGRDAAFVSPEGWLYACGCAADWLTEPEAHARIAAGRVIGRGAAEIWRLWQEAAVWRPFRNLEACKDPACFRCEHYGNGCFGSCPVHAFAATGAFNGQDPMCPIAHSSGRRST